MNQPIPFDPQSWTAAPLQRIGWALIAFGCIGLAVMFAAGWLNQFF